MPEANSSDMRGYFFAWILRQLRPEGEPQVTGK